MWTGNYVSFNHNGQEMKKPLIQIHGEMDTHTQL